MLVAPNPSSALHKISEIYDRIAFAAVGRYNEYENLRKAGVTYADITGYQFDRRDVTARGIANWYAQTLGTIFTESMKPFEVEIVVAEVGARPSDDQIYRITFDGSVTDEPSFVAFGGQADQVPPPSRSATPTACRCPRRSPPHWPRCPPPATATTRPPSSKWPSWIAPAITGPSAASAAPGWKR